MPKWYLVLPSFFLFALMGLNESRLFYRVLPSFALLILALGMCILRLIRSTFFLAKIPLAQSRYWVSFYLVS